MGIYDFQFRKFCPPLVARQEIIHLSSSTQARAVLLLRQFPLLIAPSSYLSIYPSWLSLLMMHHLSISPSTCTIHQQSNQWRATLILSSNPLYIEPCKPSFCFPSMCCPFLQPSLGSYQLMATCPSRPLPLLHKKWKQLLHHLSHGGSYISMGHSHTRS